MGGSQRLRDPNVRDPNVRIPMYGLQRTSPQHTAEHWDPTEQASGSASARHDIKMVNRCRAGIAAVLLATGDASSALEILERTNSYGQVCECGSV